MPMDKKIQALLKLGVPYDQSEPEPKPDVVVTEESGVENISLDDLSVRFDLDILRDHLTLVGDPEDIIRMYRDHPDRLNAVRSTRTECSSGCDKCESDTGDSGEKEQDEEDK
jgi:hypothetical protein